MNMEFRSVVAFLILVTLGSSANASSSNGAQLVTVITPTLYGPALITLEGGPRQNAPSCSLPDSWAIDPRNAEGQAMLSVLVTAAAQRKKVIISGTGKCDIWADRETADYIYYYPN